MKSHSLGEYVFDHGWADAYERAGGAYYPKLQIAVPFTPVPGRRLLAREPALAPGADRGGRGRWCDSNGLSSAHATFIAPEEVAAVRARRLADPDRQPVPLAQRGLWRASRISSPALSSRKRKAIRKERAAARRGAGDRPARPARAITEAHWDAFWAFYQDTGARKWGQPYLTRAFFSLLGERMADRLLLIFALRDGVPIAGALNLIGADALYGRYWGAIEEVPYLHFELCYYQAIDAAIARGLKRVEAGAQGAHKLARGYRPVPTWSAHYHRRSAASATRWRIISTRERPAVAREIAALEEMAPFRKSLGGAAARRRGRRARRGPGAGLRRSRGRSSPRRCRRGIPGRARCR